MKWSTLKRLASSRYAQLTVLVPIIGWLLVINDEFASVLASITGVKDIAQPSWKIYSLHIGLSLYGLGVGLYYLACPSAIKEHQNFNDFCANESKTITGDRLARYAQESRTEIPAGSSASLGAPADDPVNERNLWYNRNLGRILEVFSAYYEHNNDKNPWGAKWLVLGLFVSGGIITLIPSLVAILWSVGRIGKILIG